MRLPASTGTRRRPSAGHQGPVTDVRRTEVGYRSGGGPRGGNREVLEESLMLTGDENIVDIDLEVQWDVNAAQVANFVFQLQNPEGTVKAVAESALREAVGRRVATSRTSSPPTRQRLPARSARSCSGSWMTTARA